jgi:hypothetical protein
MADAKFVALETSAPPEVIDRRATVRAALKMTVTPSMGLNSPAPARKTLKRNDYPTTLDRTNREQREQRYISD